MKQVLRDVVALAGVFGLVLALRAAFPTLWPFDLFPGPEPLIGPLDPTGPLWMGAVLLPVHVATLVATGAWSGSEPAPALPGWLVAGPLALAISLAGFELMRLEPVSRTVAVGFSVGATWTLGVLHGPARAPDRSLASHLAKRALDVTLGTLLLVAFAPVVAALGAWIRRHDGGPALFLQDRVGRDGVPFQLVKLRTMTLDAEERFATVAGFNRVRGPAFRMADDPRVTAPGQWLRPTGLDELPQLVNVLRGEMSLVGPRPPLPSEVRRYTAHQRRRLAALPGITGLWQLTGRDLEDFDQWVDVDLEYIARRSLLLDLRLLLRTVPWLLARLLRRDRV